MLPTFKIFYITIAMYGLMIMIGILFGVSLAVLRGKKKNFKSDDIIFASCYAGIGVIIGAKLLYIITILPELIEYRQQIFSDMSNLLHLLTGGFVFYGGLIGALIGFYIYCKKYNICTIDMLDLIAPSIPLIHGFGRLGCYFAGCCYGLPYDGPFHILFHNSNIAPNEIPLFPMQLVESGFNFLTCIGLTIYAKKYRSPGKVLGLYLIIYAVMRFILEFLRGDLARGVLLGISSSQWISIILLPIGLWIFHRAKSSTILKNN